MHPKQTVNGYTSNGITASLYTTPHTEFGKDSRETDFAFIEWRLDDGLKIEAATFPVSVHNHERYMMHLTKGAIL